MRDQEDGATMLSDLVRYADHNRNFKRDDIDDIYTFFLDYEYLTSEQIEEIKRAYEENKVKEFIEELQQRE